MPSLPLWTWIIALALALVLAFVVVAATRRRNACPLCRHPRARHNPVNPKDDASPQRCAVCLKPCKW